MSLGDHGRDDHHDVLLRSMIVRFYLLARDAAVVAVEALVAVAARLDELLDEIEHLDELCGEGGRKACKVIEGRGWACASCGKGQLWKGPAVWNAPARR